MPHNRNRTPSELWKRRPAGIWHCIASGEHENLIVAAKRMAARTSRPIELVVLRVGVHPAPDTPPTVSFTPGSDDRPVYHRVVRDNDRSSDLRW
jgi:hypothetical protein